MVIYTAPFLSWTKGVTYVISYLVTAALPIKYKLQIVFHNTQVIQL